MITSKMTIQEFITKQVQAKRMEKIKKADILGRIRHIEETPLLKWASEKASKNKGLLRGAMVRLVYNELGERAPEFKGTIVQIEEKIKGFPVFTVEWNDGETSNVWYFQVEFLDNEINLTKEERIEKAINILVNNIDASRLDIEKRTIQQMEQDERYIKDYELKIKKLKQDLKVLEAQTKQKKEKYSKEKMIEELAMIKKLVTVDDAYVSAKGRLVVLTKDLPIIFEGSAYQIGRFIIKVDFSEKQIWIQNRDKNVYSDYGHPNLNGYETCWGNNRDEVYNMVHAGQMFQLIDFILVFYTTFPHDDGSPHVDYEEWLENVEDLTTDHKNIIEDETKLI